MARAHIVQGATIALASHGLDATVDEVAEAARVSRRTVFRHFATQSELLVAALEELGRVVDARMPAPPAPGADVEAWLTKTAVALHELSRQVIGRATLLSMSSPNLGLRGKDSGHNNDEPLEVEGTLLRSHAS